MDSAAQKIVKRIRGKQRGWVFTPGDLLDIAKRANVDFILHRLVKQGVVRRLDRGLYDFPKQHPKLGALSPDAYDIAQAIARKTGDKVQVSGARAANNLGLSTQVPAKPVFVTDGKSHQIDVDQRSIQLVHSSIPMRGLPDNVSLVLLALDWLGADKVDGAAISKCANYLSASDKAKLSDSIPRLRNNWLRDTARQIAA